MKEHVIIKSSPNGLVLTLDKDCSFDELVEDILTKFKENEVFFGKGKFAIEFRGKELTEEQEQEIVFKITQNTKVKIVCIVTSNEEYDAKYGQAIAKKEEEDLCHAEGFYKGTLRSGQVLEVEHSVVILGDVNPGAKVISKGNVVVLGALRGSVYAGANGDTNCFVAATDMDPIQIKIADVIGRKSDGLMIHKKIDKNKIEPVIATVLDEQIAMNAIPKGSICAL